MGLALYENNAVSTLAIGVTTLSVSLQVAAGEGSKFPVPVGDQWFPVTVVKADGSGFEIMRCTSRTGDVLTVTRAQEGTAPLTFTTGDIASHRITKAFLDTLIKDSDLKGFLYQGLNIFDNAGTANAMTVTITGVGGLSDRLLINLSTSTNTGAVTLDLNGFGVKAVKHASARDLKAGEIQANTLARVRFKASLNAWILENPFIADSTVTIYEIDQSNKRNLGDGTHGSFQLLPAGNTVVSPLVDGTHYSIDTGLKILHLLQGFEYNFSDFQIGNGYQVQFDKSGSLAGAPCILRCTGLWAIAGGVVITMPRNSDMAYKAQILGGTPRIGTVRPARGVAATHPTMIDYKAVGEYRGHAGLGSLWASNLYKQAIRNAIDPWQLNASTGPYIHHTDLPPNTHSNGPTNGTSAGGSAVGLLVVAKDINFAATTTLDAGGEAGPDGSSSAVEILNDGGAGGNGGTILLCYQDSYSGGGTFNVTGGLGGDYDPDGLSNDDNAIAGPGGGAGTAWQLQIV